MTPDQVRGGLQAQRHKHVFNIDVASGEHCGGSVWIIASVEYPVAIRQTLAHFKKCGALPLAHYRPVLRAPSAAAA